MALFDRKNFNGEVFGVYVDAAPKLNRNELLKSGAIVEKSQYASKPPDQTGGNYITVPIEARIGGTPDNYDGSAGSRASFMHGRIVVGHAHGWTERDFSTDITVATLNGRTVLIDGNMPTEEVAATTGENATPAYTKYTTYVLGAGASISFKALSMISPTDAQLATSSNRELANSNESGSKTEYFPIKAIPIARIITRG